MAMAFAMLSVFSEHRLRIDGFQAVDKFDPTVDRRGWRIGWGGKRETERF